MTKELLGVFAPPENIDTMSDEELDAYAREVVEATRAKMQLAEAASVETPVQVAAADWDRRQPWQRSTDYIDSDREPSVYFETIEGYDFLADEPGTPIAWDESARRFAVDIAWWDNTKPDEKERVMRAYLATLIG